MTGNLGLKLHQWLALIRVRSCFSAALLFAVGALLDARSVSVGQLFLGCASMWSAVAQIDVVNDISDRKLDVIDKPERPLPSGAVSVWSAAIASVVLAAFSLVLGTLAGVSVLGGSLALITAS